MPAAQSARAAGARSRTATPAAKRAKSPTTAAPQQKSEEVDPDVEYDTAEEVQRNDDDRPAYDLTITGKRGSVHEFVAYAPKMGVWFDTGDILQRTKRAQEARAAQEGRGSLSSVGGSDSARWGKALDEEPTATEMRNVLFSMVDACLDDDDRAALTTIYADRKSDVDVPQIIDAAIELYHAFLPHFTAEAKAMGLSIPEVAAAPQPPNRAGRRNAARAARR